MKPFAVVQIDPLPSWLSRGVHSALVEGSGEVSPCQSTDNNSLPAEPWHGGALALRDRKLGVAHA
jgi:hypothetical protein